MNLVIFHLANRARVFGHQFWNTGTSFGTPGTSFGTLGYNGKFEGLQFVFGSLLTALSYYTPLGYILCLLVTLMYAKGHVITRGEKGSEIKKYNVTITFSWENRSKCTVSGLVFVNLISAVALYAILSKKHQKPLGQICPHPGGQKCPTPQGKSEGQKLFAWPQIWSFHKNIQRKVLRRVIFSFISLSLHVLSNTRTTSFSNYWR